MSKIQLYNTLSRQKELFTPLDPSHIRVYACGPTVYGRIHVGNARPIVVFDVLVRVLRRLYDRVTYVRNITDVDDKINDRAAANGQSIDELCADTIVSFHADTAALGAVPPDVEPRATHHIDQMIAMISLLIDKGHAYAADGHVLFQVSTMPHYGALSKRSMEDMIAGARVEVAPYKRAPEDFVLWKPSTTSQPGWDSPWGRGRPGWHIECSAMAKAYLGEVFDIHAGGLDLIFPHHENEIAQSCCANPEGGFANVWLHNEMLQVEGKKMSKSLGNFFTVRDLLDQGYAGEVIRFVFLSTHYGKPMDWTDAKAKEAEKTLRKWRALTDGVAAGDIPTEVIDTVAEDLNTAGVITILHRLANAGDAATLKAAAGLLGLLQDDMGAWAVAGDLSAYEAMLSHARQTAMDTKDFSQVDHLKSRFQDAGLEVRMSKTGVELIPSTGFDMAKLDGLL